jgi:hypothetical protein
MNKKLVFVLALAPLLAQAQAYRWVDEQGKVHYTQTPPPKAPESAQMVRPPPMMPAGKAAAPQTPGEKNKALAKIARDLEKANNKVDEQRAKSDEQSAKRDNACKEAKADMRVREDFGGRTFSMDENGERHYWTKDQQDQARERIQKQIDDNC